MCAFRIWVAFIACCLAWASPCHGQALPGWLAKDGTPKPPDFNIRDESGFFTRESGASRRISEMLRKLEAERGYKIYLMVEPVLIGTSAQELAAQLRVAWLPEGNGIVVVFEADSRNVGIGRYLGISGNSEPPEELIPTHKTAALITRAFDSVDPKLAPEAYIEALCGKLVEQCEGYFTRRAAPVPPGRSLRIGLLAVGALTVLGLLTIGFGWLLSHSGMEVRSFRFPVVDRPERLGAPCGAEVISRRFGPAPSAKRL